VSFLNQLKNQATSLQRQQGAQHLEREQSVASTEKACNFAHQYLQDLARHLTIIEPAAPAFSLDGKKPWPAMKLAAFRVDARRKVVNGKEMIGTIAMGWDIVPQDQGGPTHDSISVNFPPDLERVESRLSMGQVKNERREVRHPEKSSLLAIRFEHQIQTRGNVGITADHEQGVLAFRLLNTSGFGIVNTSWPADRINAALLDELAKLIVSQPSGFV
jgi:hypothetical protein